MTPEIKIDKYGGQYKVDEGIEFYAVWIPITLAEKEALSSKGKAENVDIGKLAANLLREWMKGNELSDDELEKVAGGVGGSFSSGKGPLDFAKLQLISAKLPGNFGGKFKGESTAMCPSW